MPPPLLAPAAQLKFTSEALPTGARAGRRAEHPRGRRREGKVLVGPRLSTAGILPRGIPSPLVEIPRCETLHNNFEGSSKFVSFKLITKPRMLPNLT